jgi:hypothetical protein
MVKYLHGLSEDAYTQFLSLLNWGKDLEFIKYETQHQDLNDGSVYGDFVSHCKEYKNFWEPGNRITSAHECTHGSSNDLRNNPPQQISLPNKTYTITIVGGLPRKVAGEHFDTPELSANINAFYVGKDQAIIIPEPNMKKSDCVKFIPDNLRASRFATYITGAREWENQPLYVWDEWNAYIASAETAIDDNKHNKDSGKGADVLFGPLEFNVYATAIMMAAKEMDSPGFEKIKPFFLYNLKRSFNTYFAGKSMLDFTGLQEYFEKFKSSADISNFLKNEIGFEIPDKEISDDLDRGDFNL